MKSPALAGVLSYLGEATGDLIKLPGLSSIALHHYTTWRPDNTGWLWSFIMDNNG